MNNTTQKSFNDYLEMDGHIAFNIALYNRFSTIGDQAYSEICGGFIEGVHQWAQHNVDYIMDTQNGKYQGYTIHFYDGTIKRAYIEKWVLEIKPNDWKHAKSLFNKYLNVAPDK